jgi:AcrR family transcriptional regulator
MRRDARERREALITAAAECFSEFGYTVPLEDIADRAGVGRGTLYRNFKDRMALALAVFERDIEHWHEKTDQSLPLKQVILDIIMRGAKAAALFTRLAIEVPISEENVGGFHRLGERVRAILQPIVEKAHEDGVLRPDIGPHEILLAMRMVSSLMIPKMTNKEVKYTSEEALDLLIKGLMPG